MYKEIIKPALILFLVCAFMTAALAYVNGVTEPIIDENEKLAEQGSLAKVLTDADSFSEAIEAGELKEKGFNVTDGIEKLYEAQKDGKTVGYIVGVNSRGYGGAIKILVGIDNNKNITGVILTSHNETPGLGANAAKESFTNQFTGEIPQKEFFVVKSKADDDNEIQAVTAATISSKAVTAGINEAVNFVRSMSGGK